MVKKRQYVYSYPRPMVTVDAAVFSVRDGRLHVLLIERRNDPFAGYWALPGGFVEMDETLEQAVVRELREETGIDGVRLRQFHTFSEVDRDPRGRSISTAFLALVGGGRLQLKADDDAAGVGWLPVAVLPRLAFDHNLIVEYAVEELRTLLRYSSVALQAMPKRFRLSELQDLYEAILGERLDSRTFRRRIRSTGIVELVSTSRVGRLRLFRFARNRPGIL